ncbi:penicillin-binding protein 2 [Clostridium sp. CM028]|uniref:penicillin-binding transpeptidase domain-containing protein n=1 Tax=Clostridium sp. CM028 TaxID=2851575 RepID=UPI001C6E545E|nr:penicillin-binding transpeptidase domain-containing protein [Clostridium sp. CM028]MBW9149538.1 penicillin-binding protein 2 [Clostridium sp. CM028]WLC62110.1 penicillin-binding protein 2 [Clostridium sp. CM028]
MSSRNNIFGYSNQRSEIKKRTWTVMGVFTVLFCFLIWRIMNYMYFKSEPLKTMFNSQYTIDEQYGSLYSLTDCNGRDLLNYAVSYYAIIDPVDYLRFNEYTSKYDMQALTITLRNYDKGYDLEKIKGNGNGEKIRYKIDEVTYNKLKDIKKVKGFYTYEANEVIKDRNWKIENVLIDPKYNKEHVDPVSKKVVSDYVFKGTDSLEMEIYNKTKNNDYTKIRFAKGVNGEIAAGKIINPKNNVNVRLTLDKEIQDKACAVIHEGIYKKYSQIGVVVMESNNGKIRAMVQKDDNAYNANLGYPSTNGALPGSIFKVIVDEAGLDTNKIDNYKKYTVSPKIFLEEPFKGETFTVAEALAKSSNNIFAQLGWKIGFKNIYDYAEKQGMLHKVLNIHQEASGKFDMADLLHPTDGDTSQTAIGQNVRITPLEAMSIPNTIINNGVYVQPSIIDAYVNDDNKILGEITPKNTTILKRETAEAVKLHMMDVVNKGTGTQASIKGMDIGGKTGTTTYYVIKLVNGKKESQKCSDGWFVGFFNLNGKNYSMVVYVNNIEMSNVKGVADEEGGGTAAPIFKKVVNAIKTSPVRLH